MDIAFDKLASMSASEADAFIRASENRVNRDTLSLIIQKYLAENNPYKAYALLFNYSKYAEGILGFAFESSKGISILKEMTMIFCKENDRILSLSSAAVLVDIFEKQKQYKEVLEVAANLEVAKYHLMDISVVVIGKKALHSALSLLEDEQALSAYQYDLISYSLLLLPMFADSKDFYNVCIRRIKSLWASNPERDHADYFAKMKSLLKSEFEKLFTAFQGDTLDVYQNFLKAYSVLFEQEYICKKCKTANKFLSLVERYIVLNNAIDDSVMESPNNPKTYIIPENLLRDYYELLNECLYAETTSSEGFENVTFICITISILLKGRDNFILTTEWVDKTIAQFITKFNGFCDRIDFSIPDINVIRLTLLYLAYYMENLEKSEMVLWYGIKALEYTNVYYKLLLFSDGFKALSKQIKADVFSYHSALTSIFCSINNSTNTVLIAELYLQMSKRKNLIYSAEMWMKSHNSAKEILQLLSQDYSFKDLYSAIPTESVLIDFFYSRRWLLTDDFGETFTDKYNASCYAFILDSQGKLQYKFIETGITIAGFLAFCDDGTPATGSYQQYLFDRDRWCEWEEKLNYLKSLDSAGFREAKLNSYVFFKIMTEELLCGYEDKKRIIVSTEGDLNGISFLSLPYKDGFVVDYFAVRNIANTYDLVHPRSKTDSNRALVLSAPDYGFGKRHYPYLLGSELEGKMVEAVFKAQHGMDVDSLSDRQADREKLLCLLGKNQYRIIHFSTHGDFVGTRLFMALAGANESDDGLLYEDEIRKAAFNGADVAILALCYAGKMNLYLQDSLSGFIKSVLLAGAASALSPINPIPDGSSVLFFSVFYGMFLQDDLPIEVVLQKTINTIRKIKMEDIITIGIDLGDADGFDPSAEYPFSDPQHWASWVCYSAASDIFGYQNKHTEVICFKYCESILNGYYKFFYGAICQNVVDLDCFTYVCCWDWQINLNHAIWLNFDFIALNCNVKCCRNIFVGIQFYVIHKHFTYWNRINHYFHVCRKDVCVKFNSH